MSESPEFQINENARELMVLRALQALLGDEKAQAAMVNLQNADARLSTDIMSEAQARYDRFTLTTKADVNKASIDTRLAIIKVQMRLIFKPGPRILLLLILKAPKFVIISLPRWFKRLILR